MTTLFTNDDGALIQGADGLMAGDECCCDDDGGGGGGGPYFDCTDVVAYLSTKLTKNIAMTQGYSEVGDCTMCPGTLNATCSNPTVFGNSVSWTNPDAGNAPYCMDTVSIRGRCDMTCQGGGLFVQGSFASSVSIGTNNDCLLTVSLNPTYGDFFPWPGGAFPVSENWLDQPFEIPTDARPQECGCDISGDTLIVS